MQAQTSHSSPYDLVRWFICEHQKQTWARELPSRQVEAAREVLRRASFEQAKRAIKAIEEGRMPSLGFEPRRVTSISYLLQAAPSAYSGPERTLLDEYLERETAYRYRNRAEVQAARAAYESDYFRPLGATHG